jgi:hypothetical protein
MNSRTSPRTLQSGATLRAPGRSLNFSGKESAGSIARTIVQDGRCSAKGGAERHQVREYVLTNVPIHRVPDWKVENHVSRTGHWLRHVNLSDDSFVKSDERTATQCSARTRLSMFNGEAVWVSRCLQEIPILTLTGPEGYLSEFHFSPSRVLDFVCVEVFNHTSCYRRIYPSRDSVNSVSGVMFSAPKGA